MARTIGPKEIPTNAEMARTLRTFKTDIPSEPELELFLKQVQAKAKEHGISEQDYIARLNSMLRHHAMDERPTGEVTAAVDLDTYRKLRGKDGPAR